MTNSGRVGWCGWLGILVKGGIVRIGTAGWAWVHGHTKRPTRAWVFDQRGECWLDVVPDEMWERGGCFGIGFSTA